jgi:Domain of unknown function (DUF4129)
VTFLLDVPVEIGREQARRLAADEVARPEYHVDDPSLFERALTWVLRKGAELLDTAARVVPGGLWGLALLVLLGGVLVAFLLWRGGGVRRSSGQDTALFVGRTRSAKDYRLLADDAAGAGRWEEALQQRFRAIVRSLEERTILEPRPGRTADEAAAEAGLALPLLARDLVSAADTFDAVTYGGRPSSSADDRFMRELDRASTATQARAYAAGARW